MSCLFLFFTTDVPKETNTVRYTLVCVFFVYFMVIFGKYIVIKSGNLFSF